MSDRISVIDVSAGVLEEIEEEDERSGWSDGPEAVLTPREQAAFAVLVEAYGMPDDADDACPLCGHWTCSCVGA